MIRLDIVCGMLGAGKTTLIKQLLKTAYAAGKTAIVENEVGKVNLDAEAFEGSSLAIREVTSGCICCTVKSHFSDAIQYLAEQEHPDRIIVEPSGIADITTLLELCNHIPNVQLNRVIMVVNGKKIENLLKVAGAFLTDQLRNAQIIYLNFADSLSKEKKERAIRSILSVNPDALIYDTPIDQIASDTFPENTTEQTDEKVFSFYQKKKFPIHCRYETFHEPFSEKQLEELIQYFKSDSCKDIWRIKGYLNMEDGTVCKIDYVFGDIYTHRIDSFPAEKTNILIFMGPVQANNPKSYFKKYL